ncbi:MAG: hypothetical protein HDT16_13415 [Oscillibacter sp.]|nr:hypothetical protein [Oscillibacter sp.]
MKGIKQRGAAFLLAVTLLLSMQTPAFAAISQSELETAVEQSAAYMLNAVKNPQVGSIGGEWAVIGLARSGYDVPQAYYDSYLNTVTKYVQNKRGVLDERKYTEYSRVILALTAIGADPTNVGGYNLIAPLADFEQTIWQGVNGPVWALIALDSGNYVLSGSTTRQMYVDEILDRQLDNGGWSLTAKGGDGDADADITAMALQALAKYQDQRKVKNAVEDGVLCLSKMQDREGGYSSWGVGNCESCAQVIVALCELGIDLEDSRFVKNGNTLLDNLLSFRQRDGSFLHTADRSGDTQMASEQGFYAITAALRSIRGEASLYRMTDTIPATLPDSIHVNPSSGNGLAGKDPAVQKTGVTAPGTTFPDIAGHASQTAIEAMASRGIITGSGGQFNPNNTMTRAEFAAIVVRALGLTQETTAQFTDVSAGQWYAPFVGAAYRHGIITGTTTTTFNPTGTIKREDAAVMVARAAKLCGLDTEMEASAMRNVLAQFTDYMRTSEYARASLAFCYHADILSQSDLDIRPGEAVKRCEVAQMLYNLLGAAELL